MWMNAVLIPMRVATPTIVNRRCNFFKKPIDKSSSKCYNKDTIKEGR